MDFLSYLRGFVKYTVKVKNNENLINIIRQSHPVRKISVKEDGTLSFCCYFCDRNSIEKILNEQNAETLQRKQYGLLPCICKYKKRYGLFAGALLTVISMFASTFVVWEIRIEGNETVTDAEILKVLEEAGFYEGKMKMGVDVKSIVNRYLIKEDRISWIAINMDGTVAHVEVREAKVSQTVPKRENVNLVAKHDGIIMRVDAVDGRAVVSKGDTVTRGQLLVSAFVDKRTGGELLRGARGFVFAYTERSFEVYVPLEYTVLCASGKEIKQNTVSFFGFEIPLGFEKTHKFDNFVISNREEKIKLSDSVSLPIKLKTVTSSEQKPCVKRRTQNDALLFARELSKKRLYEKSPGFALADCDEEYAVQDGILVYKVKYSGIEDIAKELEFELS